MSTNSRIKTLRKQLNLNQAEFGRRIGLKNGAISWMEKEGNTITKQNIKIICDTFNVNKNWLLNGEGEMFRSADESDILSKLQQELKLTSQEMDILRIFVELSPEQRRMAIEFAQAFAARLKELPKRNEAHRLLDHELDAQEKAQSASTFGNSDMTENKIDA